MPAMKNLSAADDEEEEQLLCRDPEAKEDEDLKKIDEEDDEILGEYELASDQKEAEEEEDAEETSQSATPEEEQSDTEFKEIDLGAYRKDVECPICLGIIRKTRTVMECLHRFCQECIDKAMRLGKNECPACRKHCASRRSLRDDPKFDAFIAALFGDIDAYEAKEMALFEEERARKNQFREDIETAVTTRSQRIGSSSRRKRNSRNMEQDTSEAQDDDDDDNDNRGKDSSSDEPFTERRKRKRKKRSANRSTIRPSSSNANNADNDTEEAERDNTWSPPGLVLNPGLFAWGRGNTRSSARQGNNNQGARNANQGASSSSARNTRVDKLVDHFGRLETDGLELDVHLKLISLDTNCLPNLLQPYHCSRPTLLVKQLRKLVALQTQLKAEEVELMVLKEQDKAVDNEAPSSSSGKFRILNDDDTLADLKANCISGPEYMIEVYWQKQTV